MNPAAYLAEHGHAILQTCRRELLSQAPRLSTATVERLLRAMDAAALYLATDNDPAALTPLEERRALDAANALLLVCRWLDLAAAATDLHETLTA